MPINTTRRRYVSFAGYAVNLFENAAASAGVANNATPSIFVPPDATARIGTTWTGSPGGNAVRPPAAADSIMSVLDMQMQHIVEHGAGNAWPTNASAPSESTWSVEFDPYFQDLRDAGATQKVVCFNKAPRWMVAEPTGPDDQRPTNANFDNFATISAQAAARLTDFQWGVVWNEYKGFWNNTLNQPDWETYTTFYNKVYDAVKVVRPTMKVGGPYTTNISSSYQRSETTTSPAFPGGYFDNRWLTAISNFTQNCSYDFLCLDMGIENAVNNFGGAYFGADPSLQIEKFASIIEWIRALGGAAATCPIIFTETYLHIAGYSVASGGYGYTDAQLEDLFIEMCRQAQVASPNGPVWFLTWLHPQIPPYVVASTNGAWTTNPTTETTFRLKIANWHASGT